MESTHLASILFSVVSSLAFATVALAISRREVSTPMRGANRAFVVWWAGLGASTFLTGIATALAVVGYTPLPLYQALELVRIFLVCLALWGLLHYLLVLIAGWQGMAWPLGILYTLLAGYLAWNLLAQSPDHVELGSWVATLEPTADAQGAQLVLLLALIVGPQFLAALAYLALYFRVDDPLAKRRILIVSLSILIWFGAAIAAALGNVAGSNTWQLASRLLGLGAAAAILYAYVGMGPSLGAAARESAQGGPGTEAAPRPPQGFASFLPSVV